MRRILPLVLILSLASSADARRFERRAAPAEPSVIEESFGGSPGFRLVMQAIAGQVQRMGGARGGLFDLADYSRAGTLTAHRTLAVGPLLSGPALIPAGEYRLSLVVSGREGLPVLSLMSADGLRLRIPLVAAPRPVRAPERLRAVSLAGEGGGTVSVPLALHLPTVSGLVVLGPAEVVEPEKPGRRRTRREIIGDELERRALESGHVRTLKRKKAR